MNPKDWLYFTVLVTFYSSANAFDYGMAGYTDSGNGATRLPRQVMRPVVPRVWFQSSRMALEPPPHPFPPFRPQSRVRVVKKLPVVEDLKGAMGVLEKPMEKVMESLPMLTKPTGMGRLDVLQDMKKELKEAGLVPKGSMPNALKETVSPAGAEKMDMVSQMKDNVAEAVMGKIENVADMKSNPIPKGLEGLLEIKNGVISFPLDKLSEVLSNLKDTGMDKMMAPTEALGGLKNMAMGKLEDPLGKLTGMDMKNDIMEKALPVDLKTGVMEKMEDLMDMKPDPISAPLDKLKQAADMMNNSHMEKISVAKDTMEDIKDMPMDKVEDLKDMPLGKILEVKETMEDMKDKITNPLEALKDLKEMPMEKVEDLMEMKPSLIPRPSDKIEDVLGTKEDLKSVLGEKPENALEKLEEIKEAVTLPMEPLEEKKDLNLEKVENAIELKNELVQAPMEKLSNGAEMPELKDLKEIALDKITTPKEALVDLKDLPNQKIDDVMDKKEEILLAPLEKAADAGEMLQDLKEAPMEKMEDMKDIIGNAFHESLAGDRKDQFKRVVSMMSKDDLVDLHEALLSAMVSILGGKTGGKVEEAKEDLQEAVHELIEKKDDVMDPERKDALREIEHVLEDMSMETPTEQVKESSPKQVPMTMMLFNKSMLTSIHQPKSIQNSNLMMNKPLMPLSDVENLKPSRHDPISMLHQNSMHLGGIGIGNNRQPTRGHGMINHPGRRILKRSVIYGEGTIPHGLRQFPPPNRLSVPMQTAYRQINNAAPPEPYQRSMNALALPFLDVNEVATNNIMKDIKAGLQYVLQTKNDFIVAIQGTGTTGAHAVLDNLIEPGDKVLVLIHGYWGEMLANMSDRLGAQVVRYKTASGLRFTLEDIESALKRHRPDILTLVHGESSTGVTQPLDGIGDLCEKYGALLVVDVVATVGVVPIMMDKHRIDAVYFGASKGLGAVAGLAPVSLSSRAVAKMKGRLFPPRAYQTDLMLQADQWNTSNPDRVRFQSISLPVMYALREALAEIVEETMENTFRRHIQADDVLHRGFAELGLQHFVRNPKDRMVGISLVLPPKGKDPSKIAKYMTKKYNVFISTGFGPTSGQVIRIATFASNADTLKVLNVLRALKSALSSKDTNLT